MSAGEKENIYVELRKYHEDGFPDKLATADLDKLREDFGDLEDNVVSMLLSLINGKAEYVDMSDDLEKFRKRVAIDPKGNRAEDADRKFFLSKIDKLAKMLEYGESSNFKLRPQRPVRTSTRAVSTVTTKQPKR